MRMNMREWMSNLTASAARKTLPVMTYPGLGLVGLGIMDVISNGEKQYKCIKALAGKYPTAAAVTIMDLSVEAEAFGSPVKYSDNEVPTVSGRIITDEEEAQALKIPEVGEGRTGVYLEAARLAAKNIKDRPVFGGEIGPFSLAGRLFDMTEIMVAVMLEPEGVNIVLEKATEFLVEYAKAFKAAGANGIIIAEPAAGLLSPKLCEEFSSRYIRRIVEAVQDEYFMVILHNCGNTVNLVPSLVGTGSMGLHFGNAVDMRDILPQVPADRVAFGNVDPARVFKNGSASEVFDVTTGLLENTRQFTNFVLSSGCDVPPGTAEENVNAFFRALRKYNNKVICDTVQSDENAYLA